MVRAAGLTGSVPAAVLVLVLSACGGGEERLVVSAASSLTDAFAEIEAAFEAANPGVDVELNLAGSSTLRDQILEGAPADVFAAADPETMAAVFDQMAATPATFAGNRLQVAVPAGNPAEVSSLSDLARNDLLIGLCAEAVPCGRLSRVVLNRQGVGASPDTLEPSARSLLTKLAASELDVGLIFTTDIAADPDVVAVGDPIDPATEYPIAVVADSTRPALAADFVAFVLSEEGQIILSAYGFATP